MEGQEHKVVNPDQPADKGGRPSKYKAVFNQQGYRLCLLGAIDKEIAEFFEIAESTLNEWKKDHPGFSESLKKGKKTADSIVAEKLFKRATGYSHADVDIKVVENKILKTRFTKYYPPDTTAAIFWLKNRDKENWRDKQLLDIDLNNLSEEDCKRIAKYIREENRKNRKKEDNATTTDEKSNY
jgi:hypothetical protein